MNIYRYPPHSTYSFDYKLDEVSFPLNSLMIFYLYNIFFSLNYNFLSINIIYKIKIFIF